MVSFVHLPDRDDPGCGGEPECRRQRGCPSRERPLKRSARNAVPFIGLEWVLFVDPEPRQLLTSPRQLVAAPR